MVEPLLEVDNLHLTLFRDANVFDVVQGISFSIYPGEIIGLVGESGCGKSLTALAILRLLPSSHMLKGNIIFEGDNLLSQSPQQMSRIRGTRLSLILQDPDQALNPLIPIGKQLVEGLCFHKKVSRSVAFEKGVEWLTRVGIGDPHERMHQYPHQISGGMKQRILIAMALICQPSLLIADEPTTALDVTVQSEILDLLQQLQKEEGMSILLISHDLGVIAQCCQRVLVMYAGQLIEQGSIEQIFTSPQHPYTQALLQSRRSLEQTRDQPLFCLEGYPPLLNKNFPGCPFVSRCASAMQICLQQHPPLEQTKGGNVLCWLPQARRKA
jgi:oligopeptide/dipeptide ABC transporter ATP-binding protein